LGRRNATTPNVIPTKISTAAQINRSVDILCIDGPWDRYAEAASTNANPNIRTTSPTTTRLDVEARLRSFDTITITAQTVAATRVKPKFTQNAGTALAGLAPGELSDLTAGITLSANNMATKTRRIIQPSNIRLLDMRLIFIISSNS